MAGARSFERGEDYFANGQVGSLAEHEGTITAKVQGARSYRVKLWIEDGEVGYSCTCPMGSDGVFCKYCVAVGLAWLDQGRPDKTPSKKVSNPTVTMDEIREYLLGQDQKALERLRQSIAEAKRETRRDRWAWFRQVDHTELVRVFLWEKDVEAAWQEANQGGCSNNLWMELAAKRKKEHPEDARLVYQRQIEPTLSQKNNDAYRTTIDLLRKIREMMVCLGREADFGRYLESVRVAHKPKRNFMKLIDRATWS